MNFALARMNRATRAKRRSLSRLRRVIGRQQKEPGVRKHITPRYAYLVYYTIDEGEEEIIILSVQHSSQKREHDDA